MWTSSFLTLGKKIKEAAHGFFYIDGDPRFMCVSGRLSHTEKRAGSRSAHF